MIPPQTCDYLISGKRNCLLTGKFLCNTNRYCNKHIRIINSDKEVCCVCLDEINKKDWKVLRCKHHLHKGCYRHMMNRYMLKCPMCRTYLKRDIDINEQFKLHLNGNTFTYNLNDMFRENTLKTIKKRRRKDRPKYIFKRLILIAFEQYMWADDINDESIFTDEYKNMVNTWVDSIECKFELKPFVSPTFNFTQFPFRFKNQLYLHEDDVLNIIIRMYLNTI